MSKKFATKIYPTKMSQRGCQGLLRGIIGIYIILINMMIQNELKPFLAIIKHKLACEECLQEYLQYSCP